jgi:hypothetical protein
MGAGGPWSDAEALGISQALLECRKFKEHTSTELEKEIRLAYCRHLRELATAVIDNDLKAALAGFNVTAPLLTVAEAEASIVSRLKNKDLMEKARSFRRDVVNSYLSIYLGCAS